MGLESVLRRIDRWGYPIWANRIAAASYIAMPAGAAVWLAAPHWSLESFGGFTVGLAGLAGAVGTRFGRSTLRVYRRARRHIEREGRLDPRLSRRVIVGAQEPGNECIGYCEEQGLYLAARDSGQLEAFERARREYSTISVPHF